MCIDLYWLAIYIIRIAGIAGLTVLMIAGLWKVFDWIEPKNWRD